MKSYQWAFYDNKGKKPGGDIMVNFSGSRKIVIICEFQFL